MVNNLCDGGGGGGGGNWRRGLSFLCVEGGRVREGALLQNNSLLHWHKLL